MPADDPTPRNAMCKDKPRIAQMTRIARMKDALPFRIREIRGIGAIGGNEVE